MKRIYIFSLYDGKLFPQRDQPFIAYAKFSEKFTFFTPWYTHVPVHNMGVRMMFSSENLIMH